jgi:hypothetical protein
VALLFEGSERAVTAQVAGATELVGRAAADVSVWDESRLRQSAARGRVRFVPGQLARALGGLSEAVVRPAAGVAYTPTPMPSDDRLQGSHSEVLRDLLERIARELDPRGVLAG